MAKQRISRATAAPKAVTAERAARLHRLLRLLAVEPLTRETLMRRLRLDVRGFYRDLKFLRSFDIALPLRNRRYSLTEDVKKVVSRLPFPDPHLTLAEAVQLAQGKTQAHRKLKDLIARVVGE